MTAETSFDLHGVHILACGPDGTKLRGERDAVDLIGEALQYRAGMIVIPAHRLDEDFFRLKTRVAGEFIHKFVTYRVRLAIVGDISRYLADSSALRDFVAETNRGDEVWFVASLAELGERLERAQARKRL